MKLERFVVAAAMCLIALAASAAFASEAPSTQITAPDAAVSAPLPPGLSIDLGATVPEPLFLVWPPPSGCPPPPAYPCYTHTECTGYCGGPGYCYKTGGSNCGKCLCS